MSQTVTSQEVIEEPGNMTADWLTRELRDAGYLLAGSVVALEVEPWREKRLSRLYRLRATYDRAGWLPSSYVMKLSRPDATSSTASRRRWKEHEFYHQVAPAMEHPPIPRQFSAAHDAPRQRSHLLLDDLSESHARPPAPLPPTLEQARGDVDCLASIHAWWWAHPELADVAAERHEGWRVGRTAATRRNLARFMDDYERHLPATVHVALETACAGWPAILRRSAAAPLTVVHGDAHPWNFLTPLDPNDAETRLLDWEGWSIEPGPHDLASLLALHLPGDVRHAHEDELLERYLLRLQGLGVSGYGPDACRLDYRLAVARRVLSPVGMWARGSQARSWWPILERVSAAFHDLSCEEVL